MKSTEFVGPAGRIAMAASGALLVAGLANAEPRARDLGIPFPGQPGPLNAITDVAGVEVGYTTLIEGEGALQVGKGPIRTGVTAILPRGRKRADGDRPCGNRGNPTSARGRLPLSTNAKCDRIR